MLICSPMSGLGRQVLAAAASNIAVDNLVERLTAANPKLMVIRLGHPARLLPQVMLMHENSRAVRKCNHKIYTTPNLQPNIICTCANRDML